jgi:hypothetical protein
MHCPTGRPVRWPQLKELVPMMTLEQLEQRELDLQVKAVEYEMRLKYLRPKLEAVAQEIARRAARDA